MEQEQTTLQTSTPTPVKPQKRLTKPAQQRVNEEVQVQTPSPVLPLPLIKQVQDTQERINKVLLANISQEMSHAVTEIQLSAELRAETEDEELQIIMALLLEV